MPFYNIKMFPRDKMIGARNNDHLRIAIESQLIHAILNIFNRYQRILVAMYEHHRHLQRTIEPVHQK